MSPENEQQIVDAINTMNRRLLSVEGYAKGLELAFWALAKALVGVEVIDRKHLDLELDKAIAAIDTVDADEPTRVFLAAARSLLEDAKGPISRTPSLKLVYGGVKDDDSS